MVVMNVPVGTTPQSLTRWSSPEPVLGEVLSLSEQGIAIRPDQQIIPISIAWYDVRDLSGTVPGLAEYHQLADDAWRAHARLQRGDFFGAESIYTKLEHRFLWKVGAESADVSLGLVRCRLDRGDRVHAVHPALSWLNASKVFSPRARQNDDPEIFDARYAVLIDLPPVFSPTDRVGSLGAIPDTDQISDRQRLLIGYYRLALDAQAHRTQEGGIILDELNRKVLALDHRDPGLEFFKDILVAQAHPEREIRIAARQSLDRRIRSNPDSWIEVWSRLAVGVSLLEDEHTQSNELGVIELIHIIVRLDHVNHPLALLAAQIANEYLVRTDRAEWGGELLLDAQLGAMNASTVSLREEPAAHD